MFGPSEGQQGAAVPWEVHVAKTRWKWCLPLGWDGGGPQPPCVTPWPPSVLEGTHRAVVLLEGVGLAGQ